MIMIKFMSMSRIRANGTYRAKRYPKNKASDFPNKRDLKPEDKMRKALMDSLAPKRQAALALRMELAERKHKRRLEQSGCTA